ncbi:MAG TPA: NAD(P)/FAD-dependent oxidoreductase [Candidatus Acidoferrum sp.]|nr:NAD(P)/FAD-dependent oxidoreductase [Candidatus Acidoferrum sp.]
MNESKPQPENSSKSGEVIVVGASAAGLFTAASVARGGRAVRVLESKPQLEPASRTLIVTDHFRTQMAAVAQDSVINEIRRFELFTDGRSAQIALRKPDLIIERSRLIAALAREAQQAGTSVSFDTRFLSVEPNEHGLRLEIESGGKREELHGDSVVGADGAASRVARAAGWPPVETVPLVQAIVRLPKDCPPDTTRVWFIPDDTPYFYWLIPESPDRAALGVIGEHGRDTKRCFENFLEKKKLEPMEWQGARIPVYRGWVPVRRQMGYGEVFLVGDAAAQVKVSTVGGIVTGFRGALGVAQALLRKGAGRELSALRRELGTHWMIRRALHHFQQKDYSQLVDLLDVSARESLGEIHRDESTRLLWNLVRRQPRLLLLGLRGLLMGRRVRG